MGLLESIAVKTATKVITWANKRERDHFAVTVPSKDLKHTQENWYALYGPCTCQAVRCVCDLYGNIGTVCSDCQDGLHIFEKFYGNPPPHSRRTLNGFCEAHGQDCNWYSAVGIPRSQFMYD